MVPFVKSMLMNIGIIVLRSLDMHSVIRFGLVGQLFDKFFNGVVLLIHYNLVDWLDVARRGALACALRLAWRTFRGPPFGKVPSALLDI